MLPKILKPVGTFDLIRLGLLKDGGYLIEKRSLKNTKVLFSFGINNDWSFEEAFLAANNVEIHAYDHTISQNIFKKLIFKRLFKIYNPGRLYKSIKTYFGYKSFFKDHIHHHQYAVGHSLPNAKAIPEIIGNHENIYFKIDIEGSEYEILNELVTAAHKTEGLAIEFHDINNHIDEITSFIREYPLNLCHIHANNYAGTSENGDPHVLELTFTKTPKSDGTMVQLPHDLDYPNKRRRAEIIMKFRQ